MKTPRQARWRKIGGLLTFPSVYGLSEQKIYTIVRSVHTIEHAKDLNRPIHSSRGGLDPAGLPWLSSRTHVKEKKGFLWSSFDVNMTIKTHSDTSPRRW